MFDISTLTNVGRKPPEHPTVLLLKSKLAAHPTGSYVIEIRRKREGIQLFEPTEIVRLVDHSGKFVSKCEFGWDSQVDKWLIEECHAKCKNLDDEALRFSLFLRLYLKPIVIEFGDGFFSTAIMKIVLKKPYSDESVIAEVTRHIGPRNPSQSSYTTCIKKIEYEFGVIAEMVLTLYPDPVTSSPIFFGAIAQYLDERFSVTNRKLLGF